MLDILSWYIKLQERRNLVLQIPDIDRDIRFVSENYFKWFLLG